MPAITTRGTLLLSEAWLRQTLMPAITTRSTLLLAAAWLLAKTNALGSWTRRQARAALARAGPRAFPVPLAEDTRDSEAADAQVGYSAAGSLLCSNSDNVANLSPPPFSPSTYKYATAHHHYHCPRCPTRLPPTSLANSPHGTRRTGDVSQRLRRKGPT